MELVLSNDGYAEVEARLKAAEHVGPMTGKQPEGGAISDEDAKTALEERAKTTVERALEQMCKNFDKVRDKQFTGAMKEAQDAFRKCKEAGSSFVGGD